MTKETSTAASLQSRSPPAGEPRERSDLDRRYGDIGIEAVAAAARYNDRAIRPAAPTAAPIEQRFIEFAS